ncbi:MAG: DUF1592 domain-containing protein [Myxococcota bacterium]
MGTWEGCGLRLTRFVVGGLLCSGVACRDEGNGGGGGDGTDTTDGSDTGPGDDAGAGAADDTGEPPAPMSGVGPMGARRLTRYEYDNTIFDLLGDDTRPGGALLPEDKLTPFDNDFTIQQASAPLIEGAEALAKDVVERLLADPPRRDEVVGCTPTGAADEVCLRSFIETFGRRALRRPMTSNEVDDFAALGLEFATDDDDFYTGVEVVLRTFLQHGEFLYRVERGTPVEDQPGMFRLGDYEVATRMSYLLWGTTPDDTMLDAAELGELTDPEARTAMAVTMLDDPRARVQVDRFHALWMGYSQLPHPAALSQPMRQETAALLERVVFDEEAPWVDLFTATETFVDDTLAAHYGLPSPAGGQDWVDYGDSGRAGLLSHGAFLSVAANPGDTSPTKRGKMIRTQLACQVVPDPPPDVNVDEPPDPTDAECKVDQYTLHSTVGACKGCHDLMDPIGFGLENYDREGAWRDHDDGKPECTIAGDGEFVGVGTFNGPAELAQVLLQDGLLERCATQRLFQYSLGRAIVAEDVATVDAVGESFADAELVFSDLLVELVSQEAFAFRLEEN